MILSPDVGGEDDGPRKVGIGFVTGTVTEAVTEDGMTHEWRERRMFTRSDAHAERQKKGMKERLAKAGKKLRGLKPKKNGTADDFRKRAESILKDYKVTELITLSVSESVHHRKKYSGRGVRVPKRRMR